MRGVWLCVLAAVLAMPAAAQPFAREVAPFPVFDAAGSAFAQPFLGGFDTPRPTLGDVTGDGRPDLLVIEQRGAAMLFENTGAPGEPRFTWRTDFFGGLDVGEWVRLFDGDDDGDLDVLAEQPFGLARYYRNDGAGTFALALDTLRDATGAAVASIEAQNIPAFGDVTCDGRTDLLAGQLDGSLTVYPGLAPLDGLPRFAAPIENFGGIFIQEAVSKNLDAKHGASTVETGDVDGDGDVDILWGNFFSPAVILLRNTTGCPNPTFVRADAPFPTETFANGGYNVAAWGDVDGDGRGDVVVGSLGGAFTAATPTLYTDVLTLFMGTPGGAFARHPAHPGGSLDVGTMSRVALGDLDGDGDLDLLVATQVDETQRQGALFAWENVGTPTAPRFVPRALTLPADTRYGLAPTLGDFLGSDGRPDLLVGGFDGSVAVLRATGPFTFEADGPALRIPRGSNATPTLGDLDGDGDLDLLVGENSGYVNAYRNDGTAASPQFVLTTETLVARPGANVTPALADLDGDGDLDLHVGTQRNGFVVFANTGTPQAALFTTFEPFLGDTPTSRLPGEAAPAFADLDGDGDLDLMSGAQGGGLLFYRNTRIPTGTAAPPPQRGDALVDLGPTPNPSSGTVALRFRLNASARVEARVFDVLGRQVAGVEPRMLAPGTHALPIALEDVAAGVYLYQIHVDERLVMGRLVRGR